MDLSDFFNSDGKLKPLVRKHVRFSNPFGRMVVEHIKEIVAEKCCSTPLQVIGMATSRAFQDLEIHESMKFNETMAEKAREEFRKGQFKSAKDWANELRTANPNISC